MSKKTAAPKSAAKKTTAKKAQPKKKGTSETREIVYPHIDVKVFAIKPEHISPAWKDVVPLTVDVAKELLGWTMELRPTETEAGTNFGDEYLLKDTNGKKIRCLANLDNRPFYHQLADDWKLEILRKKWEGLNGETLILDKYGMVHDGQHRLIGLILAHQEWEADSKKPAAEQKWQSLWPSPPEIDALLVTGIDSSDRTVNTIGGGKKRDTYDVFYRCDWFKKEPMGKRKQLTKLLHWAVKTLWQRTAAGDASLAPRRPHSESLDFVTNHPRILECVKFIHDEAGDQAKPFIPLGYASGLLYLMGSAATDQNNYLSQPTEAALDWKLWDMACEYFCDLFNNGQKTEQVREKILSIPVEVGGSYAHNLRVAYLIKGWNLFSDGEEITSENAEVETRLTPFGVPELAESPKIGGIDCS